MSHISNLILSLTAMMHVAYLLLGGNLGDRLQNFTEASGRIEERLGRVMGESPTFETEPWGFVHAVPFLNRAVVLHTELSPRQLLNGILDIERGMGRVREGAQYNGRIIDIDILFYDDLVIDEGDLQIPHPRLHLRNFALFPLVSVAAGLMHPLLGKTIHQLQLECPDRTAVHIYKGE